MIYNVNLREVSYALSEALDYVGIDDTMHGKRVAFMSAEVAKKLGWSQSRIDDIIMLGMLHDCGVSSTDVHSHLVNELDWNNSQVHCLRGSSLLEKVGIYHRYAPVILYHHTHWDQFAVDIEDEIREHANLIYLTDRVDALRVQLGDASNVERHNIASVIQKYSGTMFSPELVDVYLEASSSDSFWFYMEAEALNEYFSEWIEAGKNDAVPFETLKNIAMMFASVVDAKSTFTSEHTYGVASLARYLAKNCNLPIETQEKIELSAFFHDLGKLRVADEILHKAGPLNDEERSHMNRHGFDSQMILRKIKGFQDIAKIASMHHETLDAKGYPYHLKSEQIPIEARILTVADIFQALVQDRPYRSGLNTTEAYGIILKMGDENKLDRDIIAVLSRHLDKCYDLALHPVSHLDE
ncbi:metal dependent phosphohydrolase [Sulfuricurvum kujiense DSM 16994]|uniref:Metal dependent phosphohydrolase n=1 Tax=Sulfuricurvum kujiense (strain ATCC BAA-921 / DSM 16994 / JCM 11577 / YK-1) TaxID=709032 RepID=E4U0H7_SULKY|nr:HD domain-containing phosphohydrolase [Sulfuricurvum kujiense]ADR34294.1 metal dependent phosphohydrolase [Sulfuricurvum kujiense DSM 16994]